MKHIFTLVLALIATITASAQAFDDYFSNRTLRIDYIFTGNVEQQMIALDELASEEGWAGRRINLDSVPVRGNGDVKVIDIESGNTIYRTSFSSLFQEWLTTDEAATATKSFEFTQLVPFPKQEVIIETTLFSNEGKIQATTRHKVNPEDKLIRNLKEKYNLTYMFVSHDLSVIEHICDRVVIMYLGKVVEIGSKNDIFLNPQHPYTQALLSAAPSVDDELQQEEILLEGDIPSPVNPPVGCRFHTRCPYATEKCKEVPPVVDCGDGHLVACHYAGKLGEAKKAEQ